jgi:6-pyruvoyltetrahydropterin/6-carboxytetrahydropterin synthase
MQYSVSITGSFDSGHVIPGHPECGRDHGHAYRVEVESQLRFEPVKRTVTDSSPLRGVVADICAELHGRSLNEMIPAVTPTPDGIASWFMERLLLSFPRVTRVTVWESPQCAFTVSREIET